MLQMNNLTPRVLQPSDKWFSKASLWRFFWAGTTERRPPEMTQSITVSHLAWEYFRIPMNEMVNVQYFPKVCSLSTTAVEQSCISS